MPLLSKYSYNTPIPLKTKNLKKKKKKKKTKKKKKKFFFFFFFFKKKIQNQSI
jgi:hypothetical protein